MNAPATAPTGPRCAHCGNDGTQASLFLTIDARWRPAEKGWELQEREDVGGMSFDCLACDKRTDVEGDEAFFPYDSILPVSGFRFVPPGSTLTDAAKDVGAGDLVTKVADGLDASMDGRGWSGEHQAAADLANAAPALVEALKWALGMAVEAIAVRQVSDDPDDTNPDTLAMHEEEAEKARALLASLKAGEA